MIVVNVVGRNCVTGADLYYKTFNTDNVEKLWDGLVVSTNHVHHIPVAKTFPSFLHSNSVVAHNPFSAHDVIHYIHQLHKFWNSYLRRAFSAATFLDMGSAT